MSKYLNYSFNNKKFPNTTPAKYYTYQSNSNNLNNLNIYNRNKNLYNTISYYKDSNDIFYNNKEYDNIIDGIDFNNNLGLKEYEYNNNNQSGTNDYEVFINDQNNNYQIENGEYIDQYKNDNYDIINNLDFNSIQNNNTNYTINQNKKIKPLFNDISSSYKNSQNISNSITNEKVQDNYFFNSQENLNNNNIFDDNNYNNIYNNNGEYYLGQENQINQDYINSIGQEKLIIDYNNQNDFENNFENIFNNNIYSEDNSLSQNNLLINNEFKDNGIIFDPVITLPPKPIKRRALKKIDFINIIYKDIGIINLGNTCFINCCLQVLIHCPNFIYEFFKKIKSLKELNKKEIPITSYFYDICFAMVDTVNTQERYLDISNFKNEFVLKHPTFGGYMPNDSQEFCRVLLEDLSNELNEIKTKTIYREYTDNEKKPKKIRDEEFDKNFKEREKSIIIDIFYSQIITTFTCECKSKTFSFQKILDFPLLLPDNVQSIDIIDLLKAYFQPETIEFEKECQKCKKKLKHKKEIKISRPPEILILSLQRINQINQTKNECLVTFPQNLDMMEFIDYECGYNKESIYSLYAVINHTGTIDFGHYYSDIKFQKKEEWYEFNDSTVTNIGNNIESFPYAYALFYIKNKYQ